MTASLQQAATVDQSTEIPSEGATRASAMLFSYVVATGTPLMNGFRRFAALALILVAAGLGCAPKPGGAPAGHAIALPFIENDFPQALARAREASLPLFVEVWAPW